MKYYKDELIKVWRRSFYSVSGVEDLPNIINDQLDPVEIEYITEFSYQEEPLKTEIYNQDTDELVYESESDYK